MNEPKVTIVFLFFKSRVHLAIEHLPVGPDGPFR